MWRVLLKWFRRLQRVEAQLNGRGRVLLRPSGTEPVVRVMIEGEDLAQVNALTEELAEIVANAAATK
jgi:phosphoglucosamine mutase